MNTLFPTNPPKRERLRQTDKPRVWNRYFVADDKIYLLEETNEKWTIGIGLDGTKRYKTELVYLIPLKLCKMYEFIVNRKEYVKEADFYQGNNSLVLVEIELFEKTLTRILTGDL